MKLFYCLFGAIFFCTTTLFASLPSHRSGLFSKKENIETKQQQAVETKKKVSKQRAKSKCGLCTIEKGKWAIAPKFGIAPTWYSQRGHTLLIGQVAPTGLNGKEKLDKFDDMFDLPLIYGGSVGYMFRKRIEFFLDLDYTHADGRTTHLHSGGFKIKQKFHDYQAFGAYLGTRLYLDFFRERLTPFLAIKVGYMHRWQVKIHETIFHSNGSFHSTPTFFHSDNTIAGSAGIGFDLYFTKWLAFSFETECLVSGQRRSATILNPSPEPILRVGDTGAMVSVPISVALKFKI
jgi:hypothetical protein